MDHLVSIIIPCYNQAQYLPEALQSVLEQTYSNWECIIVNDGSPDNTKQVAQEWLQKDSRFKYIYKENGGLSSARNAGLDFATGDYIQFLDSDDVIDKNKFELSIKQFYLEKNKEFKVVISNFIVFNSNIFASTNFQGNLREVKFNFENFLYKWDETFAVPIHCGFFASSLFEKFRFPEHLKSKEDWVMWVSLFQNDCKAIFIDSPLAFYRFHQSSITKSKDMLPDIIKAVEYFKNITTEEEFHKLALTLISRYYRSNEDSKKRIKDLKKSESHQTGMLVKKILKKTGILTLSKKIFPIILKLKK